jgi:hypothetical protein
VISSGYRLVQLGNGAWSVHSLAERETFHPVVGPVAEAEALYVKQLRLCDRMRAQPGEFVVWDVGLGAGANALTVLRAARDIDCTIRLVSFDHTIEPLCFALHHAATLGYFGDYQSCAQHLVPHHRVSFTRDRQRVEWQLHLTDFPALLSQESRVESRESRAGAACAQSSILSSPPSVLRPPPSVPLPAPHAILFDAFSPATNPAMWTQSLFTNLFRHLDPARPCAMPTYSRSTMLRVSLLLAGFYVGAGHATGEKEETTMAANMLDFIAEPLDRQWLTRARRSNSAEPLWEPVYHRQFG